MQSGKIGRTWTVRCAHCNEAWYYKANRTQGDVIEDLSIMMSNGWHLDNGLWICPRCSSKVEPKEDINNKLGYIVTCKQIEEQVHQDTAEGRLLLVAVCLLLLSPRYDHLTPEELLCNLASMARGPLFDPTGLIQELRYFRKS